MNKLAYSFVLVSLIAGQPLVAQPAQNYTEGVRNQQEKGWNKQERHDDRLDLAQLRNLVARFDQAARTRRPALLSEVDTAVMHYLGTEVLEGREELRRDVLEARGSAQEVASSQRDVAFDAAVIAPPVVARDDLRDTRRDAVDARGDRISAAREQGELQRKHILANEYRYYAHRHDDRSLLRKRAILNELVVLAEQEVSDNRREKVEDRSERAEDRQERKEDFRRGR